MRPGLPTRLTHGLQAVRNEHRHNCYCAGRVGLPVGGATMTTRIRGSDVYVVEDIERILSALAGAARRYGGDYGAGYADALRDVAAGVGASANGIEIERVHEVVEYRAERTVERYRPAAAERYQAPAPERRFAIRGEREEWPAVPDRYQAGPELALTDCGYYDFVPGSGEVRRMEAGWMWLGNDGGKTFFPVQQWVELSAPEARSLGFLVAENRRFVLVLRSLFDERRRQLTSNDRRLLR